MEEPLIWGWALILLAALLLVAEFFIPTGGVLGLCALVSAVAGVVVLWTGAGRTWGLTGVLSILVMGPAAIAYGLKVWPHTPLGRRIIGVPSDEEVQARRAAETRAQESAASLIGKEGRVLTDLRPVGTVEIAGVRYDAISETLFVPAGSRVRVTGQEVAQLKVRPVT
jgi:membrane-bound ClpP family serine protease